MITREQKIKAIYEKIANKELSFGCKIKFNDDKEGFIRTYVGNFNQKQILGLDNIEEFLYHCKLNGNTYGENKDTKFEIIGHPVMKNDIEYWVEENDKQKHISPYDFMYLWEHKRKPIEEQSDECIDYIYNLLCND